MSSVQNQKLNQDSSGVVSIFGTTDQRNKNVDAMRQNNGSESVLTEPNYIAPNLIKSRDNENISRRLASPLLPVNGAPNTTSRGSVAYQQSKKGK